MIKYVDMDERDLIQKAQQGDRDAFGELVALYQARLRAFVARYVTRPDDVYDIVQEGFIDAMQHLDRFDPAKDFGPWLRAICRNRMLNHFRSAKVRQNAAAEDIFQGTALTPGTAPTLRRLAALKPRTLALMHGPAFVGDCSAALLELADAYEARVGSAWAQEEAA